MAKKLSTTPKGKAVWPRLTGTPDTKFNAAGTFSTKLQLSQVDAAPIVTAIDAAMQGALADAKKAFVTAKAEWTKNKQGKKAPKEPELVDAPYFIDEDTGDVTLTFKMTASGENRKTKEKFTQKPVIFDAKGKVDLSEPKIGGGSTLRVSYELVPFATALGAGASLRLKAVQVIELVAWGQDAGAYGFDSEEGYTAEEPVDTSAAEAMGFTDEDAAAATEAPAGSESDDF